MATLDSSTNNEALYEYVSERALWFVFKLQDLAIQNGDGEMENVFETFERIVLHRLVNDRQLQIDIADIVGMSSRVVNYKLRKLGLQNKQREEKMQSEPRHARDKWRELRAAKDAKNESGLG